MGLWFTTQAYLQNNGDTVRRVAKRARRRRSLGEFAQNESAASLRRITKIDVDIIRSETRPIYGETLRAALINLPSTLPSSTVSCLVRSPQASYSRADGRVRPDVPHRLKILKIAGISAG